MRVRRPNIRLRGTRFWFRRRVPGPLTDRIGRGEIVRSLRTSCPREAARRARAMWLAYLRRHGRPEHPRELLGHACLRGRFSGGTVIVWEFERDGEVIRVDPMGQLLVSVGAATDRAVHAALAGTGIITLFENWLRPHLDDGTLEPALKPWWQSFSGPFLCYPGRRLVPAPLRAFIDFIKTSAE